VPGGFRRDRAKTADREGNGNLGAALATPTTGYTFIIADDHPLFRGALRQTLESMFEGVSIAEAGSLDAVSKILEEGGEVDLVLLDLNMPGVRGFSGLMYLRAQYSGVPIVVVSANEDPMAIRRCMEFGAAGFVPKSLGTDSIRAALTTVMDGGIWTPPDVDISALPADETGKLVQRLATLTPQQVRVLMMLSEGLLNKQIAYELSVSEATVKAHVSAILQKLGVESRTQAVIAASKIEAGQWQSLETS
jgi:DNA-binding NarL/FixJ family response regulator